jgi:hypothetical protein
VKTAVVAPMPRARVRIATLLNAGWTSSATGVAQIQKQ